MMKKSAFKHAATLLPCETLLYVGLATSHKREVEESINVKNTVFVRTFPVKKSLDAQSNNTNRADSNLIFSDRSHSTHFFESTIGNYSGLLAPIHLKPFWQNIEALEKLECNTTTLDCFLSEETTTPDHTPLPNWIYLDNLCALDILLGGTNTLQHVDVLIITCVRNKIRSSELDSSSLEKISAHLENQQFRTMEFIPGRHPDFGTAIFLKNWKYISHHDRTLLDARNREYDDLKLSKVALEKKIDQTSQELIDADDKINYLRDKLAKIEDEQVERSNLEQHSKAAETNEALKHSIYDELIDKFYSREFTTRIAEKKLISKHLANMADDLFRMGMYREASERYQFAARQDPQNTWAHYGLAASVSRFQYDNKEDWLCEDIARKSRELGRWDICVRLYRNALRLDPNIGFKYSEELDSIPIPNTKSHINPIFIVGCGHSGTSLLIRLLGSHPDIHPIEKESALFLKSDEHIQRLMNQWDRDCEEESKKRWVEKTPPHIFQIRRLQSHRPNAQFVLIIRDGRDVVSSLRHRPGYESVSDRIDRWVYDNVAGLPYWSMSNLHVIRYEELVSNPKSTLTELFQFLGSGFSDQLLSYHENSVTWYSDDIQKPENIRSHHDHMSLRNWQINQPIFDGRGKWKTDLSEDERRAFKSSPAQTLLEQFGYVEDANW